MANHHATDWEIRADDCIFLCLFCFFVFVTSLVSEIIS